MENNTLKKIEDAIVTKKMALPVYVNHIEKAIFWSGLNQEQQDNVKNRLNKLLEKSFEQVNMLVEIKTVYIQNHHV